MELTQQGAASATEGSPYFLQEFGKQAWDAADGARRITEDDVIRAIPVATAELDDGFFRVRTGRTSDPERVYLRAMAELGPGPVRSGDAAALLGKKTSVLGPTRDGLLKNALCYSPRYGEIDFTVPLFDSPGHDRRRRNSPKPSRYADQAALRVKAAGRAGSIVGLSLPGAQLLLWRRRATGRRFEPCRGTPKT